MKESRFRTRLRKWPSVALGSLAVALGFFLDVGCLLPDSALRVDDQITPQDSSVVGGQDAEDGKDGGALDSGMHTPAAAITPQDSSVVGGQDAEDAEDGKDGGALDSGMHTPAAADGGKPGAAPDSQRYLLDSKEGLSILRSLGPQTIDSSKARAIGYQYGDTWVRDATIYVCGTGGRTIDRYQLGSDDSLVADGKVDFTNHFKGGSFLYSNSFVAPDKAYVFDGEDGNALHAVIWNPREMTITGTLDLPEQATRDGMVAHVGTTNGGSTVALGKLFLPMYWMDREDANIAPDSRIVVIDIATNRVEEVLEVPCAGLRSGFADSRGHLWFSGGKGQKLLGTVAPGATPNCVAQIAAGTSTVAIPFNFGALTGGRPGANLQLASDGALGMEVEYGKDSWGVWTYDLASQVARPIDGVPISGGFYGFTAIEGRTYVWHTTSIDLNGKVYAVENGRATPLFETPGYASALFRIR